MKDSLADKLKNHQFQVFKTEDLTAILGNRTNISKAREQDLVQKISRGFYGVNAPLGREHFLIIQKYYPDSVVCGNSALFFQELSDYDPGPIDLTIPREGADLADSDLFTFHRTSAGKTSFGIDRINVQGFELAVFSAERCLFEVAKHGPNSEEFKKCVVMYFKKYRFNRLAEINAMGEVMSGIDVVLSALHALQESKNIF